MWILLALGALILSFGIWRAHDLSFTHDESYSFKHYVSSGTWDLLTLKDPYTNNHALNSVGMKWADAVFGPSEMALRMPNLLLLAVYLVYAALLLRPLPLVGGMAGYIIFCSNCSMLGLVTLARGYGMSIGFMLMGTYHLIRACRTLSPLHILLFHLAALLAVLSNFTLLLWYASALALVPILHHTLFGLQTIMQKAGKRSFLLHAILLLVVALLLSTPIHQVTTNNVFDFGGKNGFLDTTLRSMSYSMLTGLSIEDPELTYYYALFIALGLGALVLSVRALLGTSTNEQDRITLITFTGLFFLCSLASVVQHHLLGTDYLESRFAMFLLPLYSGMVIWSMVVLHGRARHRSLSVVLLALTWPTIHGLVRKAYPFEAGEWYYDTQTKEMVEVLDQDRRIHYDWKEPIRIGHAWVFEPTLNFYRVTHDLSWLHPADREGLDADDDYRLLLMEGLSASDTTGFVMVRYFSRSQAVLLRREVDADRYPMDPASH